MLLVRALQCLTSILMREVLRTFPSSFPPRNPTLLPTPISLLTLPPSSPHHLISLITSSPSSSLMSLLTSSPTQPYPEAHQMVSEESPGPLGMVVLTLQRPHCYPCVSSPIGKPSIALLMALPSRGATINVIQRIGVNYSTFGIFLLNDDNGTLVDALKSEHHHNAENITKAIMQRWLEGKGKTPVSWATLIGALRQATLIVLADQIEDALQHISRSTPTVEKATELEIGDSLLHGTSADSVRLTPGVDGSPEICLRKVLQKRLAGPNPLARDLIRDVMACGQRAVAKALEEKFGGGWGRDRV